MLVSPIVSVERVTRGKDQSGLLKESPSPRLLRRFSYSRHIAGRAPPTFVMRTASSQSISSLGDVLCCATLGQISVGGAALRIFPRKKRDVTLHGGPKAAGR